MLESRDVDATTAHNRADRLELAAIGTVHSVAHQLLVRYSIQLGLSPRLKVLDVAGCDRTLKQLLGTMPPDVWDALMAITDRLSITDLHSQMLKLLSAKRGNRISGNDFLAQMLASAVRVSELSLPLDLRLAWVLQTNSMSWSMKPYDGSKPSAQIRLKLRKKLGNSCVA